MDTIDIVRIAFLTDGGAGSLFVYANFLYCFRKYIARHHENVEIIVIGHKSHELNNLIFCDKLCADLYFDAKERSRMYDCDAAVQIRFFPIVRFEDSKVKECAPYLHYLLTLWRDFVENEPMRLQTAIHPHWDFNSYQYAEIMGKNVLNVMDVGGMLGIPNEYAWQLHIPENPAYLSNVVLESDGYITLQRGATPGSGCGESPKLWPVRYYVELIQLLKKQYPEKKIVQVGENDNSIPLPGVDVCLLGRTNWAELGIVLKNAWLHIDGECGMVQYRAAIRGGVSVVLFGLTSIGFYGLQSNINIRSRACPHACARLTDNWMNRCVKGIYPPLCMESIKPDMVMSSIKEQRGA